MQFVSKAMTAAMVVIVWLATAVSALAQVQVAQPGYISPPPEKFAITPGGVDVRTGRYAFNQTDLSIGDTIGGVEFKRILSTALLGHIDPFANFSHNWDITLLEKRVSIRKNIYKHGAGSDFRVTVNFDGRSDTFQSYPSTSFSRVSSGPLTLLGYSGDRTSNSVVYTYYLSGGTRVVFRPLAYDCSSNARCAYPAEVIRPDGTVFSFEYESTGAPNGTRLRSVTNNRGYALLLEYSGSGSSWHFVTKACVLNLTELAKPANGVCPSTALSAAYAYTTYGGMQLLAGVTDAVGATSTYTYAGNPAGSTSGVPADHTSFNNGYAMSYTKAGQSTPWHIANIKLRYDSENVPDHIVGRQTFADGSRYDYTYNVTPPAGLETPSIAGGEFADALGNRTSVAYDFPQLPLEFVPGFEGNYDQDWPAFMQVTPGPAAVIDPLGRTAHFDYCDRIAMADVAGCVVTDLQYYEDPAGIITNYWRRAGHLERSQQVAKPGWSDPDITSSLEGVCNSLLLCGKPEKSIDAEGNITDYTYDPVHGGLLTATLPAPNAGGVRPQKRYTYAQYYAWYKNSAGALVQAPSPVWLLTTISECRTQAQCVDTADETRTTLAYPTAGTPNNLLPLSITVAAGDGSLAATTTYTYDSQGNLLTSDGPLPGSADTTRTRYDSMRRVTGTITPDPDGSAPLPHRATRRTYSSAGDLIKVEQGTVPGQSDAEWALFAPQQTVDTEYDGLARKVRETVSAAGIKKAVTQFSYDLAQRLECTAVRMDPAQWDAQSNACVPQTNGPHGPDRITRNVYNAAGERTSVQLGVGTADQTDQVSTYTVTGRTETITDGNGNRTTYEYDGHDRLFKTRFPDKSTAGVSSSSDFEQFAYDRNGNTIQRRLRDGQLIGYGFDHLNRQILKDLPAPESDVSSSYDLQGHPLQISQASNSITQTWDALGRQRTEVSQLGTMHFDYDLAGRRTLTRWPDDFYVTYDYLVTGEMRAIREYGALDGVGVLASFDFDEMGRRQTITRGNGAVTRYTYDGISRIDSISQDLAGTTHDVSSTFFRNPASQIITWARDNDAYAWTGHYNRSQSYTINGLNQITGVGATTFSYDGRGNLTQQGESNYAYTVENRLVSAPGGASFTYDPTGRLSQSTGRSTSRFLYDGTDLVAEYNASNQLQRRYVHGPGDDEPLVWYEGSGTTDRRWFHQDERGSVIALSNSAGASIATNSYDEYGVPASGNQGRFQYTGQTWMPELGMYYYKARVYVPRLGRFLQTDPIGYGDDINLYAYVKNDPLNAVDPTGMVECADARCDTARISEDIGKGAPPIDSDLKGAPDREVVTVAFVNDNPKGANPNQPVATQTAQMIEKALVESGVTSVNINSTNGGQHSSTSLHYSTPGNAVDINRVNDISVSNSSSSKAVSDLQDAVAKQPGIRENYGPARQDRTARDGTTRQASDKIVKQHRNHIHVGGPWK